MTQEFLPKDYTYEKPKGAGRFYKLIEGDNIFRILSPAITGWEDWAEEGGKKKPVRTKDKPQFPIIQGKYPKQFWAFTIFDYREEDEKKMIKVLQITQASIMEAMFKLHTSDQWGDPKNYDLNINRVGKELETKYQVIPSPPSVINAKAVELYSKTKVNLEKLFENGDVFEEDRTDPREIATPSEGNPNHPQAQPQVATEEEEIKVENIPF